MSKPRDLTGEKFSSLTAIKMVGMKQRAYDAKRSNAIWLFQCDCGKRIKALGHYVRRGFKKSCGCQVRRGWKSIAYKVFTRVYNDGDLTFEKFIELSQLPCFYCGTTKRVNKQSRNNKSWRYNGLDRLNNNKPHNLNNVVPCCWLCNERKSDDNKVPFLNWIKKVYFKHYGEENVKSKIECTSV